MAKKTAAAAKARSQASGGPKQADGKGKASKPASPSKSARPEKKAASPGKDSEKTAKSKGGKSTAGASSKKPASGQDVKTAKAAPASGKGGKLGAAKPAPGKTPAAKTPAAKTAKSSEKSSDRGPKEKGSGASKTEKPARSDRSARSAPKAAKPVSDKKADKPAAVKPAKGAERGSKPAKSAAKAAPKSSKAASKPAKAASKPAKAASKPAKAASKPAKAASKPAKAASKPAKAASKPAKSGKDAKEVTKASSKPTKPAPKATEAAPKSAKPAPKTAGKSSAPKGKAADKVDKKAARSADKTPLSKASKAAPKPAPKAQKPAPKASSAKKSSKPEAKPARPSPKPAAEKPKPAAKAEKPAAKSGKSSPKSVKAHQATSPAAKPAAKAAARGEPVDSSQSMRLGLQATKSSPRNSGQKAPPIEPAAQSGGDGAESDDGKRSTVRRRRPVVTRSAADLLLDRAQRAFRQDRFDEARELYEKCISDYPDEARGYVFYAQFHAARNNPNEAMKEFNRALRKDANHIEALVGKAEFLETYDPPRSLNDAVKLYKTILELHEGVDNPDSQRHSSFAADRIRYCEARKLSYQSRKYLKPGQPAALKQACKYLKEAYELYPNDRRNAMNYGYVLFQVEDFENACRVCEAALRIDPKYARARLILGLAQARLNLLARARESLRQCLESSPSGSDYDDAHNGLKAVEHDLASIRNWLYDTLAGGLDDMPGLDKLKDWMTALTGETINEADLGRRKDASYELLAIGLRQRFLASPGPEGLRIETVLIPRS